MYFTKDHHRKTYLLFFLFAIFFAVISPPTQSLFAAIPTLISTPFEAFKEHFRIGINELIWSADTAAVSILFYIVFAKGRANFFLNWANWFFACTYSDAINQFSFNLAPTSGISIIVFAVNSGCNLLGALIFSTFVTCALRRPAKTNQAVRSLGIVTLSGLMTGYTSIFSTVLFWMCASILIPALSLDAAIIASKSVQAISTLCIPQLGNDALLFLTTSKICIMFSIILFFLKHSISGTLTYNKTICLLSIPFYFFLFLFGHLKTSYHPTTIYHALCETAFSKPFLSSTTGFITASAKDKIDQFEKWMSANKLKAFKVACGRLRLIQIDGVQKKALYWLKAFLFPILKLNKITSTTRSPRQKDFQNLISASLILSFTFSAIVFTYLKFPFTDFPHKIINYALTILITFSGGYIYHLFFRINNLPSILTLTLKIYSVPQFIYLPLISILNTIQLEKKYEELLHLHDSPLSAKFYGISIILSLFTKGPGGFFGTIVTSLLIFFNSWLQVLFLEVYSTTYGVSRQVVYGSGILASFFNALLLILLLTPIGDALIILLT